MIGNLIEYRVMYRKVGVLGSRLESIKPIVALGIVLGLRLLNDCRSKYIIMCSDGSIKFSYLDEFKVLSKLDNLRYQKK